MKKLIYLLCALFVSFFLFNKVSAADASLSLGGGGDHDVDTDFNATVALGNSSGSKICVVNFDLSYPSDLLELKSAPTLGTVFTLSTISDSGTAGRMSYQVGAIGCPTTGATLLTIPFHAKTAGQGTLSFSNIQALGDDDGSVEISLSQSGSSINITTPASNTPAPISFFYRIIIS